MNQINCPGCGGPMTSISDHDITTDQCAGCGGVFLDKSELNSLATGMAGDIEYCSVDDGLHPDSFAERACPRCEDRKMQKVCLLCYTDIVLDYCGECGGFFVDGGEIDQMNQKLEDLTDEHQAEEYRGRREGLLVRLDKFRTAGLDQMAGGVVPVPVTWSVLRVTVFFDEPLGLGLSMISETWTDRVIKALRLSRKEDIQTGHEDLDRRFIIQGDDEKRIKALLTRESLASRLVGFQENRPELNGRKLTLEVFDDRLVVTASSQPTDYVYDAENDPLGIINRLVSLARAFA